MPDLTVLQVDLEASDSIAALKNKIFESQGHPVANQKIIYAGKSLFCILRLCLKLCKARFSPMTSRSSRAVSKRRISSFLWWPKSVACCCPRERTDLCLAQAYACSRSRSCGGLFPCSQYFGSPRCGPATCCRACRQHAPASHHRAVNRTSLSSSRCLFPNRTTTSGRC